MVHILDTLTRLENKFDNLSLSAGASTPETSGSGPHATPSSTERLYRTDGQITAGGGPRFPNELQPDMNHLTVPHKIILWPSIYIHLINSDISAASDLQYVLQEGTPWLIRQEMAHDKCKLPTNVGLESYPLNTRSQDMSRVGFRSMTMQRMHEYCDGYFNTFNVIAPILNRDTFLAETMSVVSQQGFSEGDQPSVLALLVLALGQLAIEGVFERPVSMVNGIASGLRGGTIDNPPGIEIFNEARRRLGFISTKMTLESVQIHLLLATYYEANGRHLDFWRATTMASMACKVLIKCQSVDWQTNYGDLCKRAYWACVLNEDLYHLDLDLPQTLVQSLEDIVPLPYFHEGQEGMASGSTQMGDERSHFQYHFLAMIALRRLISRIHEVVHESSSPHQSESTDEYHGPPVTVIREMARQLESWRSLLPRPLQWQDSDKLDFPNLDPSARRPNGALFSPDQGPVPIGHKYNLDVVTAQLRTRFYYARFILYRPFVYKALHFPELMTSDDASCCALAIKSTFFWPVCMSPPKNKKRLVPHLFAWTQNLMSILLILRMTTESDCLKRICDENVDRDEIQQAVSLMLEWMADIRQIDGIADWSWKLIEPLYSGRQ